MPSISIDPLSLASIRLDLFRKDPVTNTPVVFGPASGFIVKPASQYYLITNWHVLTGKDADTEQALSNTGALPCLVRLHFIKKLDPIEYSHIDIPLDEKPWIEHPLGRSIDVVALPLPKDINFQVHALDLTLAQTDIPIYPALPISIIGFPCGLQAEGLPIWLTGYIASEPCIDAENKPLFYANVSGRPGLSGSPVVARTAGPYQDSKGNFIWNGIQKTKFMGIYSGRAHDKTEVCRVWKSSVLKDLELK